MQLMEYQTRLATNEPIAITIGNFDGVHLGHQRLMNELSKTAREMNCKPVLVTFSPHTLMVVRPDIDVHYLTTLEEKLLLAKNYGAIADSIVINFTPAVAGMSATEFMDGLCERFTIRGLVVGANFSLGHQRKGDIAFLEQYGQQHNIIVRAIPLAEVERTRISSTRIRNLVSEGQVTEANELLGHPLTVCDVVRHGDQRGRLLGFPTANLVPEEHKLLPANGVYAVRASVQDDILSDVKHSSPVYNGVANIGIRPTFNGKERIVEVHLLDVAADLYDQRLIIDFIARLRDEQRFASIDALKFQIESDVRQARQILHIGG
ncbi:MAG: bifunctional riboflavin kinase/FAD synthetase [Ktedonobacteraceae bacterium]